MVGTTQLHPEAFEEILSYMHLHVDKYAVVFPDSANKWVPLDYIKFIYKADKNFKFRLLRFLKGLTRRDFREERDEDVMDLVDGNVGNQFLSWDMTLCLMLQEGRGSWPTKKGKEKVLEGASLVKDHDGVDKEDFLTEVQEASMALMMLQAGGHEEDMDYTLQGDEVVDALPGLDVELLLPILVDGVQFLFLDDICKAVGFREDEALSALAVMANVEGEPTTQTPTCTKLDIPQDPLSSDFACTPFTSTKSIEDNVATALLAIRSVEEEYNLVPESAFERPKELEVLNTSAKRLGSINIGGADDERNDDESSTAIQLDQFAGRKGGVRTPSSGRDTSMWHYLHCFNAQVMRVIHLDYSSEAVAELMKCKNLSASLCDDPLAMNANKCILISKEAATITFGGHYSGKLLATCGLALGSGIQDPAKIVQCISHEGSSAERLEAFSSYLKNL